MYEMMNLCQNLTLFVKEKYVCISLSTFDDFD